MTKDDRNELCKLMAGACDARIKGSHIDTTRSDGAITGFVRPSRATQSGYQAELKYWKGQIDE